MSGLLNGLNSILESNDASGIESFFIVVEGFDDNNKYVLGRKVLARAAVGEQIRVRFSEYFNNLPNRPTYADLRNPNAYACLQVGFVYFVQGAILQGGVYEYRWGNIASRDLSKIFVGCAPAIVYPGDSKNGKNWQMVSLLNQKKTRRCSSLAEIQSSVAQVVADAVKKNKLKESSFMLQIIEDNKTCFSKVFSFYDKNNNELNLDVALFNIENNPSYRQVLSTLEADGLYSCANVDIFIIPVCNEFLSSVRVKKSMRGSEFYQLTDGQNKSYWRQSLFLTEYVYSKANDSWFWSMQICTPCEMKVPYMPNAYVNDEANRSWLPKK